MKIALVIGHGPRIDKGAVNRDGTTEFDWNTDLVRLIHQSIPTAVIVKRAIEKVAPYKQVNELKVKLALEFHLNSFNQTASGTEMIIYPGSLRGGIIGKLLLDAAVGVLKLPDRGVKGPQGGGRGMPFLRNTNCPAVIVESFFIDNSHDLSIGNQRKQLLAKAYADAIIKYATL